MLRSNLYDAAIARNPGGSFAISATNSSKLLCRSGRRQRFSSRSSLSKRSSSEIVDWMSLTQRTILESPPNDCAGREGWRTLYLDDEWRAGCHGTHMAPTWHPAAH